MNNISDSSPVGVLGSGSFGTAIANLLALNQPVALYARNPEAIHNINILRKNADQSIHSNVTGIDNLKELTSRCTLLFPSVPSSNFRKLIRELKPMLLPSHLVIHCTKGLDVNLPDGKSVLDVNELSRQQVKTMSEVIQQESLAVRIGCLAGPNLAGELADGQPAATVIASKFDEVIQRGISALRSPQFQVYGSYDLVGVELAGALKNIIAIAAGAINGLGYGENIKALLISKGISEMIRIGQALGGDKLAFLGLAGIGDLVATCSSPRSRNFTVGYRLAKGETLDTILQATDEVAEGINTTRIAKKLIDHYRVRAPIVQVVHRVLFENMDVKDGLDYLMSYPFDVDVDFL